MPTHHAKIRSHTRTSKNGKTHRVRAHARKTTWREMFRAASQNLRSAKPVGIGATAAMAGTALTYTLYGVVSFTAALMLAIGLISVAFISWAVGTRRSKRRRRRGWLARSWSGVLSPRRRVKYWWSRKTKSWKRRALPKWLHT